MFRSFLVVFTVLIAAGCACKTFIESEDGEFILLVEEYQKTEDVLFVKYRFSYDRRLGRLDFRDHLETKVKQRAREYCVGKGGLYTIKSRVFYPIRVGAPSEYDTPTQLIEAELSCSDEPWDMQ